MAEEAPEHWHSDRDAAAECLDAAREQNETCSTGLPEPCRSLWAC